MGALGMFAQLPIGVIAGLVGVIAFIPYIIGILNRTTKPNKATWIVWTVLGAVIAASYYAAGAVESAWVPIAYAFGIAVIALLSLKYGEEGWTPLDKWCLAGAGAGLVLWFITNEPVSALYIATAVDAVGSIPTIRKTYGDPKSESAAAWALFLVAAVLNLFAIREWTLSAASYPAYLVVLDVVMLALILRGAGGKAGRGHLQRRKTIKTRRS